MFHVSAISTLNAETLNSMHLILREKAGQKIDITRVQVDKHSPAGLILITKSGWIPNFESYGRERECYRAFLTGQLGENAILQGSGRWRGDELENLRGKGSSGYRLIWWGDAISICNEPSGSSGGSRPGVWRGQSNRGAPKHLHLLNTPGSLWQSLGIT